jgi:hypothetical protein
MEQPQWAARVDELARTFTVGRSRPRSQSGRALRSGRGTWIRTPPEHPSLGEAGEVVERAGDKPLPAWILSFWGGGEQLEKIPGTRCRFGACHGGGSIEKILQFVLATS